MTAIASDNVILITGATGAIGFEIAAQAAEAGAIVAVHGSSGGNVARAIERLKQRVPAGQFISAPADVRDGNALEAMVWNVADEAGRLDAVIHCAVTGASGVTGPFAGTEPTSYGEHAALILGTFQRLCFAAIPHLAEQGGTIIGFASDAGRFAAPRQSLIGAAFGGIMAFVRNLSLELGRQGVRIHCLSPSFVAGTPVYEKHAERFESAKARAGLGLPTPKDIAPLALFLCSPGAARITGQIISINGGLNA